MRRPVIAKSAIIKPAILQFGTILLALIGAVSARANLGDGEAQLEQRYGQPIEKKDGLNERHVTRLYKFQNLLIGVELLDGVSSKESLITHGHSSMSETMIATILKGNGFGNKDASYFSFESQNATADSTQDRSALVITSKLFETFESTAKVSFEKRKLAAFTALPPRDNQQVAVTQPTKAKELTEADKQRIAEAAESEHKRRFAPDGVVYNLKPIRIATKKLSTVIPAETELTLGKKNEDGTLHVKWNGLEADVPADDVTNDRDWLKAYHNLHADEAR